MGENTCVGKNKGEMKKILFATPKYFYQVKKKSPVGMSDLTLVLVVTVILFLQDI